jgi:energy-coupling factor transport system substrate-specific component
MKLVARDITVIAISAAIMFALKMAMVWLPNIHFGALLIIVYTLVYGRKVFYIVYLYVMLEIAVFGFNPMWSIGYLYVWSLLAVLAWFMRRMENPWGWAVLSGVFGLSFGALMAPPFLLIAFETERFWQSFLPYWISGIPYDIAHAVGNFFICLFLWKPLKTLLTKLCHREK